MEWAKDESGMATHQRKGAVLTAVFFWNQSIAHFMG
jgi:hypothetical protein